MGRCRLYRPNISCGGGVSEPYRSVGGSGLAGAAGYRLRQLLAQQPTADAILHGEANPSRRSSAIVAAIAGTRIPARKAALVLRDSDHLLLLTRQSLDQLFELHKVSELNTDFAAARTSCGDCHPAANRFADPAFKIRSV